MGVESRLIKKQVFWQGEVWWSYCLDHCGIQTEQGQFCLFALTFCFFFSSWLLWMQTEDLSVRWSVRAAWKNTVCQSFILHLSLWLFFWHLPSLSHHLCHLLCAAVCYHKLQISENETPVSLIRCAKSTINRGNTEFLQYVTIFGKAVVKCKR